MRFMQLGLEERLRGDLEPWLCYYCGECSEQCPRSAEPGETMMSLRRWLTSQYDFTGISRLFYGSWRKELAALIVTALLTGIGFTLYGMSRGDIRVYDGAGAFLPSASVHVFDWILAGVLGTLLLVNCVRMWWFSMAKNPRVRVPWTTYVRKLHLLPLHFFTQKRYRECSSRRPWKVHLALMLSYISMLVLIMFFLHEMQRGPGIDWRVHALGYAASIGLIATTIFALRGRLRREETHYKHSHETDWIFLVLLLYVGITGVVQHVMHRMGFPVAANVTYVVHMMGVVPMLALEVPFSKWAHLAYRPLAMYFSELQADALLAGQQRTPQKVLESPRSNGRPRVAPAA
jgi:hypothetical protein